MGGTVPKLTLEIFMEGGCTVTEFDTTEFDIVVAVTVIGGGVLVTVPAVTVNAQVFIPAATITLAPTAVHGAPATTALTGNALGLLLERFTVVPPAGALPVRVNVPVLICPEMTLAGLKVSVETPGGFTVSGADKVPPLGCVCVAVILMVSTAATAIVLTAKMHVLTPAGTTRPDAAEVHGMTGVPIVATVVSLLARLTVTPPVGAAPVRFTVADTDPVPPMTEAGFKMSDVMLGGITFNEPGTLRLAPELADIVTVSDMLAVLVFTVKVAVVPFAGTVTPPAGGRITSGQFVVQVSETKTPPPGAAVLMVTVPVVVVPPVTFWGIKLTLTTGGGSNVKLCVTIVLPVVAVTGTDVVLPTGFATTVKV